MYLPRKSAPVSICCADMVGMPGERRSCLPAHANSAVQAGWLGMSGRRRHSQLPTLWHADLVLTHKLPSATSSARERAPENGHPLPPGVPTTPAHFTRASNYQESKAVPSCCRNAPLCLGVNPSMARRIAATLSSTDSAAPAPPMSVRTQPGLMATMMTLG